jgi:hypothetical protein
VSIHVGYAVFGLAVLPYGELVAPTRRKLKRRRRFARC